MAHEKWGVDRLEFGGFQLDPEQRILWRDGQVVRLGPTVVQTLAVLVRREGEVVSREDLISQVWGDTAVEENSLTRNILLLRKTLKEDPSCNYTIETIPRRGYRFCKAAKFESASDPTKELAVAIPSPGEASRRWMKLAVAAAVLLCIAGLSVRLAGNHLKGRSRRSVAVLGFVNLSDRPDSAWLSPALSEMMVTELAAGGKLLTTSDESVARARAELRLSNQNGFSPQTLNRLRQELDADVVVTGAYALLPAKDREDGQIRLDLRIQDAASGETLDALSEVGEQSSLFDLVARAGDRIRRDLGTRDVTAEQAVQAKSSVSTNPQALRLYAEGIEKLRSFDALGAQEFLQQAIQADPKYALAHSAFAEALDALGYDDRSREEAKTAFELSRNLSPEEQLVIEGRYWMMARDWKKAVAVYQRLFDRFPDNVDYGLELASAQAASSNSTGALATLNSLRLLPPPAGQDPRISMQEYHVWRRMDDTVHMEKALAEAAEGAKKQGALLLLAEARARQCSVLRIRGDRDQAAASCREAENIFEAAGNRGGQAETYLSLANLVAESDIHAAIRNFQQALTLGKQVGSLAVQEKALLGLGMEYSSQGDHTTATNLYEQARTISSQLDNKEQVSGITINLGIELIAEGELEAARKLFTEAREVAVEIDNKYIEALADDNLGQIEQLEGELDTAEKYHQVALAEFQAAGTKEYDIGVTKSLGEIAMAKGDFDGARKLYQTAMSMKQASQQKLSAAEAEMALDQLLLEEGRSADVEPSLRHVVEEFRNGSDPSWNTTANDQASSLALLARCLLSEGQSRSAASVIRDAVELSRKADPSIRLSVDVMAARIRFAIQGPNSATEILSTLRTTMATARRFGYVGAELEARLAYGEIELKSGAKNSGRGHLKEVERDAADHGFVLLVRKARTARG